MMFEACTSKIWVSRRRLADCAALWKKSVEVDRGSKTITKSVQQIYNNVGRPTTQAANRPMNE